MFKYVNWEKNKMSKRLFPILSFGNARVCLETDMLNESLLIGHQQVFVSKWTCFSEWMVYNSADHCIICVFSKTWLSQISISYKEIERQWNCL